jgi:hypothetical protein
MSGDLKPKKLSFKLLLIFFGILILIRARFVPE